ncbi:hypothetical protein ACL03H_19020 [Saccharopolyspora sp. MS10]|uniref:hypothetical protein n=1 Tax=Saccharopolyspora sp. MS10 TaxID=3385973 RepID=UPI0039A0AC68
MDEKVVRFAEGSPQREWLCRCSDDDAEIALCSVGVSAGEIEVLGPEEQGYFRLRDSEIAVFRRALDEAMAVAREDLARQRSKERAQTSNR